MKTLTPELVAKITNSSINDANRCFDAIQNTIDKYEIDNTKRVVAFLSTIAVESMNLTKFEEGLYYKDAFRVASIFKRVFDLNKDGVISNAEIENAKKFTRNPSALSTALYRGYHGRGPIQITWLKNYEAFEKDTGIQCVENPDILLDIDIGFESAGWFWYINGCNEAADTGSMKAVTRIVNGPALMHLSERTALYTAGLQILS